MFFFCKHAVHGMLPSGNLDSSKTTNQFPTFYPPPATEIAVPQVTPTNCYLSAATGGLIPLPMFNTGPVPFPNGTSNTPATLYTPHTSGQCSYNSCTDGTAPVAALPSHTVGTLPVLSTGLKSSLTSGVLKYNKEPAPSPF